MTNNFIKPLQYTEKVLILDGLTGTGKTMFLPLLSSLRNVQHGRFEYMLEYLCIAHSNKKISADAFESLIKLLLDIKTYDGEISREVNFRPSDLSSVLSGNKKWQYLFQLFQGDGFDLKGGNKDTRPIPFFVTHQLFGQMGELKRLYKDKLLIVQMTRHPLYLINHWASYINYHGTLARDFTMLIDSSAGLVPWFVTDYFDQYVNGNQYEKSIIAISLLMQHLFNDSPLAKAQTVFIPFESFVLSPTKFIKQIEENLLLQPSKATFPLMKKQKVPRKYIYQGPVKKIYQRYGLKKQAIISHEDDYEEKMNTFIYSDKINEFSKSLLQTSIKQYEEAFGLWF